MKLSILILLFSLIYSGNYAQFTLSAEIRPRAEFRHGYRTLAAADVGSAKFVSQRSRLNMEYSRNRLKTKLSIQDIRVWGDESQLRDEESIALHEAWAELDLNPSIHLKMGRQELVYDDHRLLGSVNWVQQARSHDAIVLKVDAKGTNIHLGLAYNNERESLFRSDYGLANYRSMTFFWLQRSLSNKFNLSFISIADGLEGSDNTIHYRWTSGPTIKYTANNFSVHSSLFYQLGETTDDRDIGAYLFSLDGTYTIDRSSVTLGVDIVSGTDAMDADNSKMKSFNTLYATNHKFYGFMDYFLNLPNDSGGAGLVDFYAKVKNKLSDKSTIDFHGHYFLLENNVMDPSNTTRALSKGLGTEIDAVFTHTIMPDVKFNLGWSLIFATDSMESLRGIDKNGIQTWIWTMFTFKPVLLKTKPIEDLSVVRF